MGNPLDTKEGLTLLDLNDLLAYWTGKLPPASLGNNLVTKTSFSPLPIRLHPTTDDIFTGSYLLAQQCYREPFLQSQLHTTKLELKPIPLPKPTSFPLALLLNSTNILHGYTPFSSQECHPFFSPSLLYDLVVNSVWAIVGNENNPVESYREESKGAGADDSTRSIGGANESIGVDEDTIFGEGADDEAAEELKPPSDFPPPPPHFRRQIEEIKELLSELMPKKSKTALDENMDDIVARHDFSISRGDKESAPGDQTPKDNLLEGLENLEGLASPGKIGKKKDQFEESERATKEVCRKKLEAKEE
jgi:hypothetical protein